MESLPLLIKGQANVTKEAIIFRKQCYSSLFAVDNQWYEAAHLSGGWIIEVLYNPGDLREIYFSDIESDRWITFSLVLSQVNDELGNERITKNFSIA